MNKIISNNDKGMDAILQGIDLLIDERTKQSKFDRTLSGIVTNADYETNTYSVKINEYIYKDIPSTRKVNVNDSVLIKCPQNQISQMFIYDKIDTTDYIAMDEEVYYDEDTTVKVDGDIKGILTGTTKLTLELKSGSIYMLYGALYTISTGALGNNSIHVIYTSLLDEATLTTPTKLHGTTNLPYTLTTATNQTLNIKNLGATYEAHFVLKKIY